MAKKEFKHKLSEAVEKMSYDVLPEAKPEDFEITTVAAVSEPFADARARNKAAKEKFKKMIDIRTKQAKETLGLDDQLKERQANGNGKLVEDLNLDDEFHSAMYDARWASSDFIWDKIRRELEKAGIFDTSVYRKVASQISEILDKAFEDIADVYKKVYSSGKLTEATTGTDDDIMEAFRSTKWVAQDKTNDILSDELQSLNVYNERCYITATNLLYQRFNEAFKEASTAYKRDYAVITDGTAPAKISLDESLFEAIENKKPVNNNKKLTEAKIIMDAKEYKPWQGAVTTYEKIQEAGKLDDFYALLDEAYPSGIDSQALNDLLWFDADWVYEMLGMEVEE